MKKMTEYDAGYACWTLFSVDGLSASVAHDLDKVLMAAVDDEPLSTSSMSWKVYIGLTLQIHASPAWVLGNDQQRAYANTLKEITHENSQN